MEDSKKTNHIRDQKTIIEKGYSCLQNWKSVGIAYRNTLSLLPLTISFNSSGKSLSMKNKYLLEDYASEEKNG